MESSNEISDVSGPGRRSVKVEINFNNPQKLLEQIKHICTFSNTRIKKNIRLFAKNILDITTNHENKSVQTKKTDFTDQIIQTDYDIPAIFLECLENMNGEDHSYFISSVWMKMEDSDKVKLLMLLYDELGFNEQCDLLAFQGYSLNKEIYEASKQNDKAAYNLNLNDLKTSKKSEFYENCDGRLKSFIDNLTNKEQYENDNLNFKSNIYENILKARNNKFTSKVGLKEHMVVYLASGKAMHASQVFSKQGAKGTRPILEKILTNSADDCKFTAPKNGFLFYSFDNIQTLLKSYRIGGNHQKKALAIVVCSILCLMFLAENIEPCELQFDHENTPASWYTEYTYVKDKGVFAEQLSSNTLQKCIHLKKEEEKVLDDFFEAELKYALEAVNKDMDENL